MFPQVGSGASQIIHVDQFSVETHGFGDSHFEYEVLSVVDIFIQSYVGNLNGVIVEVARSICRHI